MTFRCRFRISGCTAVFDISHSRAGHEPRTHNQGWNYKKEVLETLDDSQRSPICRTSDCNYGPLLVPYHTIRLEEPRSKIKIENLNTLFWPA